ncbi:hypothetical protein PIB30_035055 [Stylosanthes scabra]|uniref:RING-type domain-containing protein n=1 Tax=Stylosanthes scabra TaxID=79078 RepID=A0ABU6XD50_9FABA|nr:hypothetical protein [Stylosanthes scabra]
MVDEQGDFAGTICSICYEDLKPVSEDLQSISICGHVFHELCLQQWFEYCSRAKKHTCPVCKQSCRASDACRLYFQSVGDVVESVMPRKPFDSEEDSGVLRKEVKRLEVRVSGLSSELEKKGKEIEKLNKELGACKEQAKIDIALKNEALSQKASMETQLRMKSEELEKSTFECYSLQKRNITLAKEIAAFKLVSDLDLNEEEVLKYATLGNGFNDKDTIDTLSRSMVRRNRDYKDLIAKRNELAAKCNHLEKGEARYSRKLEKAKEKILKLKARVQELETAAEVRENQYLKSLKASKMKKCSNNLENSLNSNNDVITTSNTPLHEQTKQTSTKSEMDSSVDNSTSQQFSWIANGIPTESKALNVSNGNKFTPALGKDRDFISLDDDASEFTEPLCGRPRRDYNDQYRDGAALSKPTVAKSDAASEKMKETVVQGTCNMADSSRIDIDVEMANNDVIDLDDDITLLDNVQQVQPKVNIIKESPPVIANPGDICFSGGLLGPDGSHRYLGKWCKRGQNGESQSAKGGLIAVGADGRGGRIKVLRTAGQTFKDEKENDKESKRVKVGPKTSSLRPQGCLQIEHFFARVNH